MANINTKTDQQIAMDNNAYVRQAVDARLSSIAQSDEIDKSTSGSHRRKVMNDIGKKNEREMKRFMSKNSTDPYDNTPGTTKVPRDKIMSLTNSEYTNSILEKLLKSSDNSQFNNATLKYQEQSLSYMQNMSGDLKVIADNYRNTGKGESEEKDDGLEMSVSNLAKSLGELDVEGVLKEIGKSIYHKMDSSGYGDLVKTMYDTFKGAVQDGEFGTMVKNSIQGAMLKQLPKEWQENIDKFRTDPITLIQENINKLATADNPILRDIFGSMYGGMKPDLSEQEEKIDMSAKAVFDNKFYTSVTRIIPEQLYRIVASLEGKEQMIYDWDKQDYITETEEIAKRIQSRSETSPEDIKKRVGSIMDYVFEQAATKANVNADQIFKFDENNKVKRDADGQIEFQSSRIPELLSKMITSEIMPDTMMTASPNVILGMLGIDRNDPVKAGLYTKDILDIQQMLRSAEFDDASEIKTDVIDLKESIHRSNKVKTNGRIDRSVENLKSHILKSNSMSEKTKDKILNMFNRQGIKEWSLGNESNNSAAQYVTNNTNQGKTDIANNYNNSKVTVNNYYGNIDNSTIQRQFNDSITEDNSENVATTSGANNNNQADIDDLGRRLQGYIRDNDIRHDMSMNTDFGYIMRLLNDYEENPEELSDREKDKTRAYLSKVLNNKFSRYEETKIGPTAKKMEDYKNSINTMLQHGAISKEDYDTLAKFRDKDNLDERAKKIFNNSNAKLQKAAVIFKTLTDAGFTAPAIAAKEGISIQAAESRGYITNPVDLMKVIKDDGTVDLGRLAEYKLTYIDEESDDWKYISKAAKENTKGILGRGSISSQVSKSLTAIFGDPKISNKAGIAIGSAAGLGVAKLLRDQGIITNPKFGWLLAAVGGSLMTMQRTRNFITDVFGPDGDVKGANGYTNKEIFMAKALGQYLPAVGMGTKSALYVMKAMKSFGPLGSILGLFAGPILGVGVGLATASAAKGFGKWLFKERDEDSKIGKVANFLKEIPLVKRIFNLADERNDNEIKVDSIRKLQQEFLTKAAELRSQGDNEKSNLYKQKAAQLDGLAKDIEREVRSIRKEEKKEDPNQEIINTANNTISNLLKQVDEVVGDDNKKDFNRILNQEMDTREETNRRSGAFHQKYNRRSEESREDIRDVLEQIYEAEDADRDTINQLISGDMDAPSLQINDEDLRKKFEAISYKRSRGIDVSDEYADWLDELEEKDPENYKEMQEIFEQASKGYELRQKAIEKIKEQIKANNEYTGSSDFELTEMARRRLDMELGNQGFGGHAKKAKGIASTILSKVSGRFNGGPDEDEFETIMAERETLNTFGFKSQNNHNKAMRELAKTYPGVVDENTSERKVRRRWNTMVNKYKLEGDDANFDFNEFKRLYAKYHSKKPKEETNRSESTDQGYTSNRSYTEYRNDNVESENVADDIESGSNDEENKQPASHDDILSHLVQTYKLRYGENRPKIMKKELSAIWDEVLDDLGVNKDDISLTDDIVRDAGELYRGRSAEVKKIIPKIVEEYSKKYPNKDPEKSDVIKIWHDVIKDYNISKEDKNFRDDDFRQFKDAYYSENSNDLYDRVIDLYIKENKAKEFSKSKLKPIWRKAVRETGRDDLGKDFTEDDFNNLKSVHRSRVKELLKTDKQKGDSSSLIDLVIESYMNKNNDKPIKNRSDIYDIWKQTISDLDISENESKLTPDTFRKLQDLHKKKVEEINKHKANDETNTESNVNGGRGTKIIKMAQLSKKRFKTGESLSIAGCSIVAITNALIYMGIDSPDVDTLIGTANKYITTNGGVTSDFFMDVAKSLNLDANIYSRKNNKFSVDSFSIFKPGRDQGLIVLVRNQLNEGFHYLTVKSISGRKLIINDPEQKGLQEVNAAEIVYRLEEIISFESTRKTNKLTEEQYKEVQDKNSKSDRVIKHTSIADKIRDKVMGAVRGRVDDVKSKITDRFGSIINPIKKTKNVVDKTLNFINDPQAVIKDMIKNPPEVVKDAIKKFVDPLEMIKSTIPFEVGKFGEVNYGEKLTSFIESLTNPLLDKLKDAVLNVRVVEDLTLPLTMGDKDAAVAMNRMQRNKDIPSGVKEAADDIKRATQNKDIKNEFEEQDLMQETIINGGLVSGESSGAGGKGTGTQKEELDENGKPKKKKNLISSILEYFGFGGDDDETTDGKPKKKKTIIQKALDLGKKIKKGGPSLLLKGGAIAGAAASIIPALTGLKIFGTAKDMATDRIGAAADNIFHNYGDEDKQQFDENGNEIKSGAFRDVSGSIRNVKDGVNAIKGAFVAQGAIGAAYKAISNKAKTATPNIIKRFGKGMVGEGTGKIGIITKAINKVFVELPAWLASKILKNGKIAEMIGGSGVVKEALEKCIGYITKACAKLKDKLGKKLIEKGSKLLGKSAAGGFLKKVFGKIPGGLLVTAAIQLPFAAYDGFFHAGEITHQNGDNMSFLDKIKVMMAKIFYDMGPDIIVGLATATMPPLAVIGDICVSLWRMCYTFTDCLKDFGLIADKTDKTQKELDKAEEQSEKAMDDIITGSEQRHGSTNTGTNSTDPASPRIAAPGGYYNSSGQSTSSGAPAYLGGSGGSTSSGSYYNGANVAAISSGGAGYYSNQSTINSINNSSPTGKYSSNINDIQSVKFTAQHEGFVNHVYRDSEGYRTIGYGFNIDSGRFSQDQVNRWITQGITKEEAEAVLSEELGKTKEKLLQYDWYNKLDPIRQGAILDMSYNMGIGWVDKFPKAMSALKSGDYETAANEILDSTYARQTKGRAQEIAELIRYGEGKETNTQITPQGTIEPTPLTNGWASPVEGKPFVTSAFGRRNVKKGSRDHQGIDIRASKNAPILAAKDGVVKDVFGAYNTVILEHPDGTQSKYLHNTSVNVEKGQEVKQGDQIATAGNIGKSGRPVPEWSDHLHFEILKDGKNIDPFVELGLTKDDIKLPPKNSISSSRENIAYVQRNKWLLDLANNKADQKLMTIDTGLNSTNREAGGPDNKVNPTNTTYNKTTYGNTTIVNKDQQLERYLLTLNEKFDTMIDLLSKLVNISSESINNLMSEAIGPARI